MTEEPGEWLAMDGLAFNCVIGVTVPERTVKQRIVVNLRVKIDFAKIAFSDAIQDTIDYRTIAKRVIEAGSASRFQLIETLASSLAKMILDEFPPVQVVRVELEKPRALRAARSVRAVVVSRRG